MGDFGRIYKAMTETSNISYRLQRAGDGVSPAEWIDTNNTLTAVNWNLWSESRGAVAVR